MKKIIITIAIVMTCFIETANCEENDTHSSSKSLKAITIQVSSHKKAENAQREINRLKDQGLDVFVDYEQVKDKGLWHRVYIGRFESREEATKYAKELVDKGIISGFWVKQKKIQLDIEKHEVTQEASQEQEVETHSLEKKASVTLNMVPAPPSQETEIIEQELDRSAPKKTEAINNNNELSEEVIQENYSPSPEPRTLNNEQVESKFSIGLKSSLWYAFNAPDFKISNSEGSQSWSFRNKYVLVGLVADLRLTDKLAIESSIEKDFLDDLDMWLFCFGANYQFKPIGLFVPFVRGSIIIGQLEWDEAPGDFDRNLGLDGGVGIFINKSNIKLGLETSYRRMRFNYNPPSGNEYSANSDFLDMSGIVLSGTLQYLF